MGLFDFFRAKDGPSADEKELLRLQKMVSNKLTQNVDREDALHRLASLETVGAAKVLLSRFSWTLNPSIRDHEEKEIAVRGIAAAGEEALPAIREYCVRANTLTWPLKAIRLIVGPEGMEDELLNLLDGFDTDYMRDPAPKVQLMQALSDFDSDDVRIAAQPFLTDMSEEVRFAAVGTVLGCKSEEAVESLVAALVDEESLRVQNRIAAGIVESGFTIPEAQVEALRAACPPGFQISSDRKLTGRPA